MENFKKYDIIRQVTRMQYVIMSDGNGTRWNNYLNITKQQIVNDGENLLEIMARQIKNSDKDAKIIISSHNPNHKVDGCMLYDSEDEDTYKRIYLYEKINKPTIFLYGYTYHEDNVIETIVNASIEKVIFYGNENAIIAIKVNDYDLFKKKLNIYNGTKTLLHEFEEYDINKLFVNVGYDFKNINTSDDYQSLVKTKKMTKNKR